MTTRSRFCAAFGAACAALIFALAPAAQAQTQEKAPKAAAAAQDAASTASQASKPAKAAHKVIVYYFHGGMRCTNCTNFEKYTDELMKTGFGDAIKNGSLEWKIVNTDERKNAHFMKDFNLYTKSIVVVDVRDGKQQKFKNLEGIWQVIGSKARFQDYVRKEVTAYLGAQ